MRRVLITAISALAFLSVSASAWAVNPDEVLDDPTLEARARSLSAEIRCLVCQNQSIDDSDAQLARDLRVLVREQLTQGSSDQEILDFLVARYGEFVLLKPRLNTGTIVLWSAPFVLLLVAGGILMMRSRQGASEPKPVQELTREEQVALDQIIGDKD